MSVYKRLKEAGEFNEYLIPSEIIVNPNVFFDFLDKYKKVVFKPQNGHKGEGVICIEKLYDVYKINRNKRIEVIDYCELENFIYTCLEEDVYLAQPYIQSKTKNGLIFDLRLHLQKMEMVSGELQLFTHVFP